MPKQPSMGSALQGRPLLHRSFLPATGALSSVAGERARQGAPALRIEGGGGNGIAARQDGGWPSGNRRPWPAPAGGIAFDPADGRRPSR
ncbi:protein of unknown function [Stenotrophomonas maltophilia]|nr:protein of unknown function [Stenotrophomonas maltophilia]